MDIVSRFLKERTLSEEEFVLLLQQSGDAAVRETLRREALALCRNYYGNQVYIRGLIEFTNYCKNNCYYCGIRRDNPHVRRYRLSTEEILSCCREGYGLGYRTFVLQGGEDPYFTDERMTELIRQIREEYPDCAITLSIGEREKDSYRKFREAGADRYLLRHETADAAHYRSLHPEGMNFSHRIQCLYDLKELGYQVGAGFMVGSPGQKLEHMAKDLLFLQKLQPEMVGIGPFIPHHDTRYAKEQAGSVEMTLFLLSVIRILLPKVLLPATTALGTMDPVGREKGLLAGANVIMPNLSPEKNRKDYSLYDNKICTGEEAAQSIASLRKRVESVGCQVVTDRGDAVR
ncbi:[FeFe] hydrogenase H-cluster radical SAM maturase HydE [Eubacterium sp. An11]|uniref:[FeFe] hydrogenase H-cluster radical SAM maturase HydE n=1 Tax=Eubacterium sp. An11 TaxID=1965542 RepID=UPI000B3A325A|nr:[FeFe] hydrogenase H-cluster radical SAM maturase HydE [Eubacterium sp. An11]OUQ66786.1 [FeFe] hydrogenase H-cluster radical SAM maturase HydE [Eubacterium sp. An11]